MSLVNMLCILKQVTRLALLVKVVKINSTVIPNPHLRLRSIKIDAFCVTIGGNFTGERLTPKARIQRTEMGAYVYPISRTAPGFRAEI